MSPNNRTGPLSSFGGYDSIETETVVDDYEMSTFGVLSPPDHDSASMRSGTTPLLETSKLAFVPSLSTPGRLSRDQNIAKPRKHLQGWRMGITLCAATAGTVLIVNLSLTIWASVKFDLQDGGLGTVQEGSCQKTRDLSLWLHLAINVLSTLLLSASNYCMQCLSAPTREEVDRAHHRGKWLDIGVPSLRNLTGISWYRLVLWWLLALSGIPLHLLYNSAVFSTLSSVEYQAFVGTSELVSGVSIDWSTDLGANSAIPSNGTLGYFEHVSSWTNLTNYECILAYGKTFVSKNRDVLAVTSQWNTSASLLSSSMPVVMIADATSQGVIAYEEQARPPYVWICGDPISGTCDISEALINADGWTLSDDLAQLLAVQHPISYCLSQSIKERCRLRFSVIIMSIVIGCNLTKTICMLLILRRQRSQPLTTLGDAIESFLLRPDSTTEQMRLRCRDMERRRWFHGASLRRWLTCNVLCVSTLVVSATLLNIGLNSQTLTSRSITHLWDLGYGAVNTESLVAWNFPATTGLHLTVLIANSPQALLSFLFLTYNGLFTCMLLADEWSGHAKERKTLRVTSPIGQQRSTYRLQLPYKYSIPLLIVSGTLHWLVSQSLFLARVEAFDLNGTENPANSISTVGYSCIAIITVIPLGTIVVLLGILNGYCRRYEAGMPVIGSCSACMSAACHPPRDDVDAAYLPLMWGEPLVSCAKDMDRTDGRLCFTSFEVAKLGEGRGKNGPEFKDAQARRLNRPSHIDGHFAMAKNGGL